MQNLKKLIKISIEIDPKKTTSLKKSELSYELYKFYIIEKQYSMSFYAINQINFFKYIFQKDKLFYDNIAKNGKIVQMLKEA